MNNKDNKLSAVYESGFALYDAMLFLDTHSENEEAKKYYASRLEDYKRASAIYEKEFGPLIMYTSDENEITSWVKAPLPWEAE